MMSKSSASGLRISASGASTPTSAKSSPDPTPKSTPCYAKPCDLGGGRVAIFRNHSKVFLCRAGARAWVIESSANINTNPRTENTVITSDLGLYEHHKAYFDSIKSFARDFDEWQPAP